MGTVSVDGSELRAARQRQPGLRLLHAERCVVSRQHGDFAELQVTDAGAAVSAGAGIGVVDPGGHRCLQDGAVGGTVDDLTGVDDGDVVNLRSAGHGDVPQAGTA